MANLADILGGQKKKQGKATHVYSNARLNDRRRVALDNLQKRLSWSSEKILESASRFRQYRNKVTPEVVKATQKDLEQYRGYLENRISVLKERVKKAI